MQSARQDGNSSPNNRQKGDQINLYERIATEMRSKALREELKKTLKTAKAKQNI